MKIMVLIFALMLAGCADDQLSSRTKCESLRSFVESVSYTRSGGNRDAIGPEQRMLWYGAAPTSRQAARVVEADVISMEPNHDAKIDFLAPDRLEKGVQ
jgi:hypothetical protein